MEWKTLNHKAVLEILPDRDKNAHKGNFGKILLLCGSRGYTGAAALAGFGALRSGAGLVYLGVPESIYDIMAVKLTEVIVFPLPEVCGMLAEDAIDAIQRRLEDMDAVLIGPGLGLSEGTASVVNYIIENFKGPVVLDADGINLIGRHKDKLRGRTGVTILTPHQGEFQRLGCEITGSRQEDAVAAAKDLGAIVVLKGHNTLITDGVSCFVNPTGNPGMAVGGSGDVLAGMIVSLLGQGIEPMQAAVCGAWLHGAAGDICAEEIGQYGMLPSDILQALPRLMK